MNSFGQISASAFGFNNTNSLALASAKFDFTLFKVEAPAEYAPFGSSLSITRREEAEAGPIHRTARRLAALFEQKAPSTPKLTSAYGKRVSELINKPGVNPGGSHKDGPFARFVGADGTAIWAAATSGSGALGICLLALLLARAWHSSDSAAIWVDIVEARKLEIQKAFHQNDIASEGALMSSLQDISRSDLRLWDASARSWLLSADQGMQWHLKQLELTTRDLGVPFGGGASTYEKIMSAWRTAADCIESLLCGHPQSIQDQAVLRAISAWHLFPDLLVLRGQTTPVRFRDLLFESTALATIGLESIHDSPEGGIRWSLALSHLQYYGPPVEVESQLDTPRVTVGQLRLVALGALFAKWKVHHSEYLQTAHWMNDLWSLLCADKEPSPERNTSQQLSWLYPIIQASKDLLLAESNSPAALSDAKRLVSYGHRRGIDFLGGDGARFEPFFGLCNVHVLAGLRESNDMECGVSFFRSIAAHSGLQAQEGFVLSSHWTQVCNAGATPEFFEYATLAPVRSVTGSEMDKVNFRWLHESDEVTSTDERARAAREIRDEQVRQARRSNALERNEHFEFWNTGAERPGPRWRTQSDHGMVGSVLEWIDPPDLFIPISSTLEDKQTAAHDGEFPRAKRRRESIDSPQIVQPGHARVMFTCIHGAWNCGLYLRDGAWRTSFQNAIDPVSDIDAVSAMSALTNLANKKALWNYMCGLTRTVTMPTRINVDFGISMLTRAGELSSSACNSLHALSAAGDVFESILVPTISLESISKPLGEALWKVNSGGVDRYHVPLDSTRQDSSSNLVPLALRKLRPGVPKKLSRAEAFACVIYLDTGRMNLHPEDLEKVLAVSSDNSLYIAGIVLSDPADAIPSYDIRRRTGSIGRAGVSLLIAPREPNIRGMSHDHRIVTHAPYDFKREDNFKNTSMHLTFTNWVQPLDTGGSRLIDKEVNLIESVISVREDGVLVADLDILGIELEHLPIISAEQPCPGHDETALVVDYTSIDSWEELLDGPVSVGILRAHGNWAARLAAVSILCQQGKGHAVGLLDRSGFCLKCLEKSVTVPRNEFRRYESGLPSFCID